MFSDSLFKKIENKTNVKKESILSVASKLQNTDLKDEASLRDIIKEIGAMAGKDVSKEKEDKIVETILKDKVPKDLGKMVD